MNKLEGQFRYKSKLWYEIAKQLGDTFEDKLRCEIWGKLKNSVGYWWINIYKKRYHAFDPDGIVSYIRNIEYK